MILSQLWVIALFFIDSSSAFDLETVMRPPSQQKVNLRFTGMLQPAEAGVLLTNFSASVPVFSGEKNRVTLTSRYHLLNFYPDQSRVSDLRDIQVGAAYSYQIEEKRMASISASFGSASDQPFKDSNVNTVSATALYTFPSSETESWLLLLNYSNNRPILNNIPLPGFAYIYAPSKEFRGTFGVPFASIYWQFIPQWSLTLFTVAPWVAKAQVAYSIAGPFQVFTGVDFSQMTYLQYGRVNKKERLYYDEKKAFIGAKSPLNQIFFVEIEAGYAFGRQLFAAEKYTANPVNPTELDASGYGKLSVSAAF